VNLLIRASQQNRRSITLTAPRVTLFNGQRSNVIIARQISFVSDLEPIPGAIGFDPTLSVTQSGVVLDVEATVSADRRYVTMTARPSLATVLQPIRTIVQQGSAVATGGVGGGVGVGTSFGFIEAPELELTNVRTSVSVPDKGTLLMGGQRLVADVEIEAGVPILSKVPLINRLFTNRTTIKDERTLLILIKPTIMLQAEQEDALFPGLMENPQQYNIGRSFTPAAGVGTQ
jgi:type II secretory pathway component GspD/PulD (secretin)